MSKTRPLTAMEAVQYVLDPRNDREFSVMAQSYGDDDDWCGLYTDDVGVCTVDGKVELDVFDLWGPFELWWDGDDPGSPQAPFPFDPKQFEEA